MLILKILADLKHLWSLILSHLFETLQDVLVEVINAFVHRRPYVLVLDYAEDDVPYEHALEEDIELHGRLG